MSEDIDARLGRLEALTHRALEILLRLEHRFEAAGAFGASGGSYSNTVARFAFENGIEYDFREWGGETITRGYQKRVADWLESHEGDPKASFMQLEMDFGHEDRGKLIATLQYFYLDERWEDMIDRLDASGHPSRSGMLTKNPYAKP